MAHKARRCPSWKPYRRSGMVSKTLIESLKQPARWARGEGPPLSCTVGGVTREMTFDEYIHLLANVDDDA